MLETSLSKFCLKLVPNFRQVVILICVVGIALDLFVEISLNDTAFFVWKDVVNLLVIGVAALLVRFGKTSVSLLLTVSLFVVLLSMYVAVFFWDLRESFDFDTYYLKFEVVSWLFVFVGGILLNWRVIVWILVLKLSYTITVVWSPVVGGDLSPYVIFIFLTIVAGSALIFLFAKVAYKLEERETEAIRIARESEKSRKMELIHVLGHDVKQPFGQIAALVEMLESDKKPITDEEIHGLIRQSVDHGNMILKSLVSWAEASSFLRPGETATCNFTEVTNSVIESQLPTAQLKGIDIVSDISPAVVNMDGHSLTVVLRNLISNAIKFSHNDSRIEIKSVVDVDVCCISIIDQGAGMSQERIEQLLADGKNESEEGTQKEKGTGLGLEICKDLLSRNKAKLTIESEVGKGTLMKVCIPM